MYAYKQADDSILICKSCGLDVDCLYMGNIPEKVISTAYKLDLYIL